SYLMNKTQVDWLLLGEPRPNQIESLMRSYLGMRTRDRLCDSPQPRKYAPAPQKGFALFQEMRLGKTSTLLNEYLLLQRDGLVKRLLVIAPNKYKNGWNFE